MVAEQQKQLSSEVIIHDLTMRYFEAAGLALSCDESLQQSPMSGDRRQVAERHAETRDKLHSRLLTHIVRRLLTSNGEVSFDQIIERSIDPNDAHVVVFERYGGSFSGWLQQLKSDTIDATAKMTVKLIEDNEKLEGILEETEAMKLSIMGILLAEG